MRNEAKFAAWDELHTRLLLPAAPARSDVMEQSCCCVCGRFMRMEIVKVSSRHRAAV